MRESTRQLRCGRRNAACVVLFGALAFAAPAQADLGATVVCTQAGLTVQIDECFALVSLYNSTRGDSWTDATGWGSADVESWFGVSIDAVGRTVLAVELPSNNLEGIVPSQLDALPNLQSLLLADNRIADRIPSSLGRIPALRNLDLSDNFLIGSIPAELGDLAQLRVLVLNGNTLDGPIPSSFAQLDLLHTLYLFDNALSGPIDVLAQLPALRSALLGGNGLTGSIPSRLGLAPQLELLFLDRNALSGPIPACLGNATTLQALVLFDNALEGTLPPALGNLTNLDTLSLGQNRLRGTLPDTFVALPLDFFLIDANHFDAEPNGFATIPPALQPWFEGIASTNIAGQTLSGTVFEDGFEASGCAL